MFDSNISNQLTVCNKMCSNYLKMKLATDYSLKNQIYIYTYINRICP